MKNSGLIVRPATAEDIKAFSDSKEYTGPSMRAMVFELDGTVVGLGGVTFEHGSWLAFADFSEELKQNHKFTIGRESVKFFRSLKRDGIKRVYAARDKRETTSLRYITHLGFKPDPESKDLYRWGS